MIEKEKLLPVRMQVVNKTGGGSTVAAAYLFEKKGDPHTIGFFTGVWLQQSDHHRRGKDEAARLRRRRLVLRAGDDSRL